MDISANIKPSKILYILNNYRQISLFGIPVKYMKDLAVRTKYILDTDLISQYNMGFLRGKCTDIITMLTNDIYNAFDKQVPTYAVFFDIISCYDVVQSDILIHRLRYYFGITGMFLGVVADLFVDCWTRTIVNEVGSDWLLTVCGLGQGRPASPIFNLLYIEPLHM